MVLFCTQCLTIAAIEDVLRVVLPIIFMGLYLAGQLLSAKKKQAQNQQPQVRPEVRPPQHPQRGGEQVGNQPASMEAVLRKEVDDFLQRTQKGLPREASPREKLDQQERRSARRQSRPNRSRAAPPEGASPAGSVVGDIQEKSQPARASASFPREQPASDSWRTRSRRDGETSVPASGLRSQSVSDHVAEHIGQSSQVDLHSQELGQHAEQLGAFVEGASGRTQRRLVQKFDHKLGNLQHQEKVDLVQGPSLAEEVGNLLRSPEGMRQLIIAKEILQRPKY